MREQGHRSLGRGAAALVVGCGLLMTAACASSSDGGGKHSDDVTVLIPKATKLVRSTNGPTFAKASFYEADGTTKDGKATKNASGVVKWRFVFNNQSSTSSFRSAFVNWGPAPEKFGKVTGNASPYLEDVEITKAPSMTLADAVGDLQKAGYKTGFTTVTLRDPLGPQSTAPLYIFGMENGKYVGVDTQTKKVSVLST